MGPVWVLACLLVIERGTRKGKKGRLAGGKGRRTKRLLGDDARVVGRVVDDRRLDEVAGTLFDLLGADGELVTVLLAVLEELLYLLVLHFVLDGPDQDTGLVARADLDALGEGDHGFQEGLVDVLVDVDALGGDADLARVIEGAHGNFGGGLFDVDVWEDDGGIVAAADRVSLSVSCFDGGDWTDSSSVTRLRVLAAFSIIFLPVAIDPVKEIFWMLG